MCPSTVPVGTPDCGSTSPGLCEGHAHTLSNKPKTLLLARDCCLHSTVLPLLANKEPGHVINLLIIDVNVGFKP